MSDYKKMLFTAAAAVALSTSPSSGANAQNVASNITCGQAEQADQVMRNQGMRAIAIEDKLASLNAAVPSLTNAANTKFSSFVYGDSYVYSHPTLGLFAAIDGYNGDPSKEIEQGHSPPRPVFACYTPLS